MTLLLVVAGLAIVAWLSQLWDERERRKASALLTAALQETEALCTDQHAKQVAYVEGYAPDQRSMNAAAGKPMPPRADTRNRRKAA